MKKFNLWVLCSIFLLSALMASVPAQAAVMINNIRIEGTERIEPATVMTYLDISPGDEMTQYNLDRALKSLFATGLFADVSLRQDGRDLVVSVVENPVINKIAFEGNDQLENDELLSEIQLRPRQVFTRTKVQADVERLFQIYRRNGRFSISIDPKVIKLDQNRVDLVFEINEGEMTTVKSIRFIGNKRFSDDQLRSEISTKEDRWYRFFSADDRYDPDRMEYDQELLRRFYLSQGYIDFRLISATAELSADRKSFFVNFTVDEGERYKIGDIKIETPIRKLDTELLRPDLQFQTGDWYDADLVQETVSEMTDKMGDLQYAFVNIRPDIHRRPSEAVADVVFIIDETQRVFVERIDVHGNVRTLDKVVRREMELIEGDPFNRTKLGESEKSIKDLDFFEKVEVKALPGSAPDQTVLDVAVEEKSTGELSLGAGFSTSDGPLADFRLRERNFLGGGQDVLFATTLAGKRTEFNLSLTEPYFLDRDFVAGIDLFHTTRDLQDESSYDQKRTGMGFRFGYPLSERWRQTLRYGFERSRIENVQSDASRLIREQEGTRDTSAISQRLTYDDRDSKLFPTEGLYYWLSTELAGLGGDAKYISGRTGASHYTPIADGWVFNLLGETGAITGYGDEDIQINERFFLGGTTLRGFQSAGVGPRDRDSGDSLGGNIFYRGTAELSFPLGLPEELGIGGHLFSDMGALTSVDEDGPEVEETGALRASGGVGVSWRSPFGPIRVDLAYPITKEDFDKTESFRFNFGTRF